jgi:hypothetical protein
MTGGFMGSKTQNRKSKAFFLEKADKFSQLPVLIDTEEDG